MNYQSAKGRWQDLAQNKLRSGSRRKASECSLSCAPQAAHNRCLADEAEAAISSISACYSNLEFDLEVAKEQSSENPVYYVQYAHARICSVLQQAVTMGRWGVRAAVNYLEKRPVPPQMFTAQVMATKENLGSLDLSGVRAPDGWKPPAR